MKSAIGLLSRCNIIRKSITMKQSIIDCCDALARMKNLSNYFTIIGTLIVMR